jgi:hypothetical protein
MLQRNLDPPARKCLDWRRGVQKRTLRLKNLLIRLRSKNAGSGYVRYRLMLHIFANSTAADTRNRRLVRPSMIGHDFGFPKGADGQRQGSPFAHLSRQRWV